MVLFKILAVGKLGQVLGMWAISVSLQVFLLTFVERKLSFISLKIAWEWHFTFQHPHIVTRWQAFYFHPSIFSIINRYQFVTHVCILPRGRGEGTLPYFSSAGQEHWKVKSQVYLPQMCLNNVADKIRMYFTGECCPCDIQAMLSQCLSHIKTSTITILTIDILPLLIGKLLYGLWNTFPNIFSFESFNIFWEQQNYHRYVGDFFGTKLISVHILEIANLCNSFWL